MVMVNRRQHWQLRLRRLFERRLFVLVSIEAIALLVPPVPCGNWYQTYMLTVVPMPKHLTKQIQGKIKTENQLGKSGAVDIDRRKE